MLGVDRQFSLKMKLLKHFVDPGEASAARARLEQAGIAAEVEAVDPHIVRPSRSGAQRIGLWVVSEAQFDAAAALLEALIPDR